MVDIEKLLDETESLLADITQVDWAVVPEYVAPNFILVVSSNPWAVATPADFELIDHAPDALRKLCKEVRRLRESLKDAEDVLVEEGIVDDDERQLDGHD